MNIYMHIYMDKTCQRPTITYHIPAYPLSLLLLSLCTSFRPPPRNKIDITLSTTYSPHTICMYVRVCACMYVCNVHVRAYTQYAHNNVCARVFWCV